MEQEMPIRNFIDGEAFDPETIDVMSKALANACTSLGLVDRDDPVIRLVALKILDFARAGEHDAARLTAAVLKTFQH
jgi:hypothetical protein